MLNRKFWLLSFTVALLLTVIPQVGKSLENSVTVTTISNTRNLNSFDLTQQASKAYQNGNFHAAAIFWQQAVLAFQQEGDMLNQAMALSNLSLTYQQLGQWSEAQSAIEDSFRLLGFTTPIEWETRLLPEEHFRILAQTFDIQGKLYLAKGHAESAIDAWKQATNIYERLDDNLGIVRNAINQAQAMQIMGLYQLALRTLDRVEQNLANEPDSLLKASVLQSLGKVLRMLGKLDKSREVLQQSLRILRNLLLPVEYSDALLSLCNTEKAIGARARNEEDSVQSLFIWNEDYLEVSLRPYEKAVRCYQQVEEEAASPSIVLLAQLNHLNLLLDSKPDWISIEAILPQLKQLVEPLVERIRIQLIQIPHNRKTIYAQINYALSLMRLSGLTDLPKIIEIQTLDIVQVLAIAFREAKELGDMRSMSYALGYMGQLYEQTQQLSEAQKLTQQALSIAEGANAPYIAYLWHWQLGRLLYQQKDALAIQAYEQAIMNVESLIRSLAVDVDANLLPGNHEFSFQQDIRPLYVEMVELLLQSDSGQTHLLKTLEVIESLRKAELDSFFGDNCLEQEDLSSSIENIDSKAAIVYPIILPNQLEIIFSLPHIQIPDEVARHYHHHRISIKSAEVEETLEKLSTQLLPAASFEDFQPTSQKVYNWLIKPVESELEGIETIVFVLDGAFWRIPMSVLHDGRKYLVERFNIAVSPGLRLLEPRLRKNKKLSILAGGLERSFQGFSELPNIDTELEQILKLGVNVRKLLDNEFTFSKIQNEMESSEFDIIHLATHGQFSSRFEDTFILTADDRININELRNLLRSVDPDSPRAIELLILSACATSAGDERAVLGLAGMAVRVRAGSTLAPIYAVYDRSTAVLMGYFYQELIGSEGKIKRSKAEALRYAQIKMLKSEAYQHPAHWSPFLLVGNWL